MIWVSMICIGLVLVVFVMGYNTSPFFAVVIGGALLVGYLYLKMRKKGSGSGLPFLRSGKAQDQDNISNGVALMAINSLFSGENLGPSPSYGYGLDENALRNENIDNQKSVLLNKIGED